MAKYKGRLFVLGVEATPGGGTFGAVGGVTETSLDSTTEAVDVTDKDDGVNRTLLQAAGIHSKSLGLSGWNTDSTTLDQVEEASNAGTILNYQLTSEKGDQYEGAFLVTAFNRNGAYNGAEAFSCTLESSGEIAYTAAP